MVYSNRVVWSANYIHTLFWKFLISIIKVPGRFAIRKIWKAVPLKEMMAHTYVTWKTGCGKSSLVEQRIYYQWRKMRKKQDKTIIVLDPHWSTVEKIRKFDLARDYFDTHIYIDPTLSKWHTPTINPLECRLKEPLEIELMANQLVTAFQEMIPDSKLSNQMKTILKPCIYVLLSLNTCNLVHLQEFMNDKNSIRVNHWKQSQVKAYRLFFEKDFNLPIYNRTKQSIKTKIQSLLNSQVFYNTTIWSSSTINLEKEIRKWWKVILFNLSKWKIGEEITESLWRFLLAKIKSIALMRHKLPPHLKKPIYLILEEADAFINWNSLNVILKETRKFGLHVIVITQNIVSWKDQEKLKRNLINNSNVKIIWANGLSTLKALSLETGIAYKILQELGFYEFRIKYGSNNKKKIKIKNVLGRNFPMLLSRSQMISQTFRMVHKTWYYKPIISSQYDWENWNESWHSLVHNKVREELLPRPKFRD